MKITICWSSSVARGGGGARASPLACKVFKIARFWCFWGRFLLKNWKQHPPKEFGCRSCEVDAVIRPEKAYEFPILAEKSVSNSAMTFSFFFFFFFFFWDYLLLGRKSVWVSEFGRKIRFKFGEDLCFWRSPVFGPRKRLNFRFWPKNLFQIWRRPFFLEFTCFWAEKAFKFPNLAESYGSKQWKFGSRLLAVVSFFQNSLPLFQILATRLCRSTCMARGPRPSVQINDLSNEHFPLLLFFQKYFFAKKLTRWRKNGTIDGYAY